MTAFTINGGATTLWDSLTGGSVNATLDTYTISNNTTLKIDTDSYQCANHSLAAGSLDTVSFSGIGGRVLIDGTQVRVIPFNTGSGTVPVIGTSITQGGVSGPLLGVWANWQSEPLAAAAAMPATGFIKIKSKAGGNFAAGALTGITATATGPDVVGWIEVRGADTAAITVPRIGKFETIGDWFELGLTSGARAQVLPCPTTATVAGVFPAVWIETAAGSGVFERYAGVGSMVNLATNPMDERGKVVWQTTAGIRIGSDGTNNVGFLPPAGCKVRVPNIILTCCTRTVSGSGPRVLPNATLATRQEFATTTAGDIALGNTVCQWYANFLQAFKVKIRNSVFSDTLVMAEIASPLDVDNAVISPTQAQINYGMNLQSDFAGGLVKDVTSVSFSLAASGRYVNLVSYCKGVTFNNVRSVSLTTRANATSGTWVSTQNVDCIWTGCKNIGGRLVRIGDQRPQDINTSYADNFAGTTTATNPHYAFEDSTGCVGHLISGLDFFGLANVQPYNGLVSESASYGIKVRNIGTAVAPLDLGVTNGAGVIFNGAGNNDGIKIQRVHCSNTRLAASIVWLNSDNNIQVDNVSGDYADTPVVAGLNATMRGVKWTGTTAGQTSVYGTHWKDSWTSATVGKIEISCNEPTVASASQCVNTGGTPRFNSAGQVALTSIGDQVTWEMPYFAKGHTALANLAPTNTGTNPTNLTYEFQYDKGAGYNGTWLVINAANLTGAGAITPSVGVKLKVRVTCATANAGNLLTNIAIPTVATTASQNDNPYPLDTVSVTLAANSSLAGAEVRVYDMDNNPVGSLGSELAGAESNIGSGFAFQAEAGNTVWVQVQKSGFEEYGSEYVVPSSDATLPVFLNTEINT
jgi:hypothetical protein